MGFVHIEWGSYTSAADCFTEALDQETTPVQQTYLLLLLSRVYTITEDHDKALGALKDALRIEPYCLEARFEEIVRYFQLRQPSRPEAASLSCSTSPRILRRGPYIPRAGGIPVFIYP